MKTDLWKALYTCPFCHDGHDWSHPDFKVPSCMLGTVEVPLIGGDEEKMFVETECCRTKFFVLDYFLNLKANEGVVREDLVRLGNKVLIFFLGNSIAGIRKDAAAVMEGKIPLVIARDDEKLTPPEDLPCIRTADFAPAKGTKYTVIGNGGTTEQMVPTIKKLVEGNHEFEIVKVARGGDVEKLW